MEFPGYEVIEKIGEGGMCVVYRVRHLESGAVRALKVLTDKDPSAIQRFADEAKMLMQIHHPNVIEVFHLEETRPPWLVMEILAEDDLDEIREASGPLDPVKAAQIFADISNGLEVVHRRGVRHRDIKPANIMLNDEGTPHLIDFGIARDTSQAHMTTAGFVVGTAAYMPPEVFISDRPNEAQDSAAADVYALGQALCEVLTGKPVHSREGAGTTQMVQIIKDKMDRPYLDPRDWHAAVPEALAAVVMAATMQEPEERIQTAAELERRLRAWLGSAGVVSASQAFSAVPPPPPATIDSPFPANASSAPETAFPASFDAPGGEPAESRPSVEAVPPPAPPQPEAPKKPSTQINSLEPVRWQAQASDRDVVPETLPPFDMGELDDPPTPLPADAEPSQPTARPDSAKGRARLATPAPPPQRATPEPPQVRPQAPRRGRLGALFGAAGTMTIGVGWAVIGALGLVALWFFRPVPPAVDRDHLAATHAAVASAPGLSACPAGSVTAHLVVRDGMPTKIELEGGDEALRGCVRTAMLAANYPKGPPARLKFPIRLE